MDPRTEGTPESRGKRGKWMSIVIALIVILLIAGAAYLFLGAKRLPLGGSSGTILATVNGAPITTEDVEERISHAETALKAQGLDLSDAATKELLTNQALQEIINETVVLADAARQGISVTDVQVDEQLNTIRSRFETPLMFTEELAKNNFTEVELRENIRRELTVQAYLDKVAGASELTVTSEEVAALYEQLKGQNESLPALSELRADLETQVKNQKLGAAVGQIVERLRSEASVEVMTPDAENAPAAEETEGEPAS